MENLTELGERLLSGCAVLPGVQDMLQLLYWFNTTQHLPNPASELVENVSSHNCVKQAQSACGAGRVSERIIPLQPRANIPLSSRQRSRSRLAGI
jgi:hypothetical protein